LHQVVFANFVAELHRIKQNCVRLRPSSDVVLLPCRTKLQFGSTVARQEINFDSDVVPESNQIQGLLEARNNSPPNSLENAISPERINIIYEFSLARQKHDV